MQMIRRLVAWLWRAWPFHVMAFLVVGHFQALAHFPADTVFVNKLTGTVMQIVGGLVVLHSVDSNLGLFRNYGLASVVVTWFRECPLFLRSVTVTASLSASCGASASATARIIRSATTVEERLAELERALEELRSETASQHQAIHTRIDAVRTELSSSIASNQAELNKLSERVERATVGGFKQQAFGVMLVIYGAATSVFA
jgi:hypothetical protein